MGSVEIFNETNEEMKELETLPGLIDYAIEKENVGDVIFNVILVDEEKIHGLNREYRNIDRPTDVITFALEDGEDVDLNSWRILGDIYISIDKAKSQAIEYGHPFLRELAFLTVHGFLHLLGYDHMTKEDEKVMFGEQEEILNGYGITR